MMPESEHMIYSTSGLCSTKITLLGYYGHDSAEDNSAKQLYTIAE
jgi:hypothetical protein